MSYVWVYSFITSVSLYILIFPSTLCLVKKRTFCNLEVFFSPWGGIKIHIWFFYNASISTIIDLVHSGFNRSSCSFLGTYIDDNKCTKLKIVLIASIMIHDNCKLLFFCHVPLRILIWWFLIIILER